MGHQIVLNIIIALVWMFLKNHWSFQQFVIGYLVGILMIGLLSRFWPNSFYLRKLWSVILLLLLFLKELVKSSFTVLGQIMRPKLNIRPGIFAYRTELKTDWEITVLSCLICLTPGTLTMEVSREGNMLYIHAMDINDKDELAEQIRGSFERAIKEVTRS
ncbi:MULTISPECIES: Na+/H+ antiporter subunit E [Paenibacillus]|uniref:Na+/H+ antiporter subunit E n=1 Tax=Paenibacillus campinasensis TaxID=66347 RepID=A0A268EPM9_9BACL|nr:MULTISPECIES: Na+/H+ antiporter subunit E [Paenibacillus]MUG67465.1 Na+/H+ antiporter subunit E [Paenibacillus campinasensis]PAD75051.1 Na+/H+ antiporter subunit E [Paenibacillus campinasensis]PAK50553.1 Na+/H+ antiporter subunit E [Paenibacillus sp. 7541]